MLVLTVKRLDDTHKEAIKEVYRYSFPDISQWDAAKWEDYFSSVDLPNSFGYFVDEEGLVSTLILIDFQLFIRGILMDVGGIAGVATLPKFRRQGHVTALMSEAITKMKNDNQYVSALYPFKHSFYRTYGYEVFGEVKVVKSDPKNIVLPQGFKPLKIRELSKDESFEKVKEIRVEVGSRYNLILYKDLTAWKLFGFRDEDKIFVVEDGGKVVGYFIFRFKNLPSGEWDFSIDLREVIVSSEDALLTFLDFIKKHTDQIKEFWWPLLGDERIFDYFDNLWIIKMEMYPGAMFRLVDVEKALQILDFPKHCDFSFSMKLYDEFAPWNEEPFYVEIKEGRAKVQRMSKFEEGVDLETDIHSFTQLFVGFRTVEELATSYKMKVNPEVIPHLAKAFPKRTTRLITHF